MLGYFGPQRFPAKHVAIGDVESLIFSIFRIAHPEDRFGKQIGVGDLLNTGVISRLAREGQRQAKMSADGGISTDGGNEARANSFPASRDDIRTTGL